MLHSMTPTNETSITSDGHGAAVRRSIRSEYLLVCEAQSTTLTDGRWHFSIEAADGTPVFDAGDDEIGDLNRLTLLAAVRGLEAMDGPASVTLLSNNRYLIRSLSDSLPRWRKSDFVWEHFGRRIDVQHADLWRRIDRALSIHRVEACLISSRLVSNGSLVGSGNGTPNFGASPSSPVARQQPSSGRRLRIDAPHGESVPPGKANRQPSDRQPSDRQPSDRQPSDRPTSDRQPSDRLRRWLLETGSSANDDSRRRFTAADLLETS